VIIACLWLPSASAHDDFYDEKVWSLGATAQLYCNNSAQYPTAPNDSEPVSWMLPNLRVLYGHQGRFQILNNNWTLEVINVSNDDLGLYHCMLRTPDTQWLVLRIGLNAIGPYFEDPWNKYWLNTVIGLSTSLGFLLIAIAVCLIYHFRYRQGDDDLNSQHGQSTSAELSDNDGTVTFVGIVGNDDETNATHNNGESSTSSKGEMNYVGHSRNVEQQCATQF